MRELDLARRLVYHAVRERVLPKHLEPDLVHAPRPEAARARARTTLRELAARITDRNFRLFAERGELHVINGPMHLAAGPTRSSCSPRCSERDAKIDPAHAFYLGYEMAKAVTALTLGKNYAQDQALRWGLAEV